MANKPAQQILHGLLVRGFSQPQAAALAGNIQQESSFNPAAYNKSSNAQGLMQWRLDRATGLANYARDTGRSAQDVDTQLDYIVHEMQGPEAKNVKDFLTAQDVQSANAALKKYIRYGDTEAGNRLGYAQAFADAPAPASGNALTAANTEAGGQSRNPLFVNPAFPNAQGPVAPDAASQPVAQPAAQPAAPAPQPAPANDDDILKAWLPADASPTDASTTGTSTASSRPASSADDDILKQFLPPEPISGAQTPGAFGNNPMAIRKSLATAIDYKPSSVPILDQISAFGNAAANAVPIVGPALSGFGNNVDATFNNALAPVFGFKPETADDVAAQNAAQAAKFPLATTAGAVTGTVLPIALAGGTVLGGNLLGTSGNLLTRGVVSGLSSGAIGGADTLARGGSLQDAGRNALLDAAVGAAVPVAGFGVAGGSRNMLARTAAGSVGGAAIGGAGTLLAGGNIDQAGHNALIGAAVGAGGSLVGPAAGRLISTSPEIAQLAQVARDKYKIPIGPGQISANPLVNKADTLVNKIPFSGGTASSAAQNAAFSGAIADEMGSTGARSLGPSVMGPARSRISGVFRQVAKNTTAIPSDQQFDTEVINAMSAAQNSVTPQQFAPLNSQFNDIMATFKNGNGSISGDTYLKMTERGSPLDAAIHSTDPAISQTAMQLKEALDGAMQRAASPADAAALRTARYQWKVMRTVEDMAEKAGDGPVSPALLMGAVRKNFPSLAYDGAGNMGELANIGQRLLKPAGTSNTAENLKIAGGLAGAGDLLLHPEHIPAAVAIAGGAIGAGRVAGSVLRSPALANLLINSSLRQTGSGMSQGANALMRGAVPAMLPPGPGGPNGPLRITVRGANQLVQ